MKGWDIVSLCLLAVFGLQAAYTFLTIEQVELVDVLGSAWIGT